MTVQTQHTSPGSPVSTTALQALVAAELSTATRVAHVTLLLVSSAMGVGLLSLWLTEPALPLRTHWAFGVMTAIAASWAAYAVWALTRRRVLFGRQRVVAARMAVIFTSVFVAGSLIIGAASGERVPFAAAALGAAMLAVAVGLLLRARRIHAQLVTRRDELARVCSGTPR